MEYRTEEDRKYTKTHEWLKLEGGDAVVGISDYAQCQLSDVVFVDLPEAGTHIEQGAVLVSLESVKAVGEAYAPVSGQITEVNMDLADHPEWVNEDPYGKGWLVKMKPDNAADLGTLQDAATYAQSLPPCA